MSDNAESNHLVNGTETETFYYWGAEEIGRAIRRNKRQTHHLLTTGQIKSAKKLGGRWVISRSALLRDMGA
jgi:hypothetical protein